MFKYAQRYINHLEAENESKQVTIDSFTDIGKMYSEIKAEAYKEVVEKLKKRYSTRYATLLCETLCEDVDILYKELTKKSAE